jgi:hypothetical protein
MEEGYQDLEYEYDAPKYANLAAPLLEYSNNIFFLINIF